MSGRPRRKLFADARRRSRWNRLTFSSVKSPFESHPRRIIIDITAACDLGCIDCNRSCGKDQAPSSEHMSPDQIRKFVGESLEQDRSWYDEGEPTAVEQNGIRIRNRELRYEGIRIEGGEPTLHPQLGEVLGILLDYKRHSAPSTNLVLCTNGHGERARRVLKEVPSELEICDSRKQARVTDLHCAFNMAPVDDRAFEGHDFSKGCWLPMLYGIGLTRHGYYPHPICAGIDRVLGLDIGLKKLPPSDHSWTEHYDRLCRYCGHYNRYAPAGPIRYARPTREKGKMSPFWQAAYARYQKERPVLSLY